MPRKNLAARMGGWSAHHRWLALGLWFAFVIAAIVGGAITGQVNLKESQLGDGEAGHAARVIDDAGFKDRAGEMIIITDPGHTVDDPSFRAVVNQAVDRVSTFPQVTNVRSPLASSNSGQVTKDGRSVLVQFDITGPIDTAKDRIQPVMNAAADLQKAHPEMHIAEFGQASADHVLSNKIDGDLNHARNVSLPLTLIILLFAFGAAVAAGIPVLLAFSAVLATFGLNSMISHLFMPTTDVTAEIILMIGMAVGVDYSLFYLRRERDERAVTKTADQEPHQGRQDGPPPRQEERRRGGHRIGQGHPARGQAGIRRQPPVAPSTWPPPRRARPCSSPASPSSWRCPGCCSPATPRSSPSASPRCSSWPSPSSAR